MSFIPSFILSALFFCTVSVPGGWDEASFSEGIFCKIPYTTLHASFDEKADELPALKNAAAIFEHDALSLKLAAGSLAVSGTGGSGQLSATLPSKDDGVKPLSLFAHWHSLNLYASEGRLLLQCTTSSPETGMQNALTAGWTHIAPTKSDDWFLRYPWHPAGNLHYISDGLTTRMVFPAAHLDIAGTVALSVPDMFPPSGSASLDLLLKADATETGAFFFIAPSHFMTPAGTFTADMLKAQASFAYKNSDSIKNTESAFKASGSFSLKQPSEARQLSKRLFAAAFSYSLKKADFALDFALSADSFCFEDGCRNGTVSPALALTLASTEVSAKAALLPFQDESADHAGPPAWSVKAIHSQQTLSVSYTAEFSGPALEAQKLSVKDERGTLALDTVITMKKDSLSWTFSLSKQW